MPNFNPKDKICFNCKYVSNMIAIGQGLRCSHPSKREEGKMPPTIPSRSHTCELFEYDVQPKS